MQKAHEEIFDLILVQFVIAQHTAAGSRSTLVLKRQKTNKGDSLSYQGQTEYWLKHVIYITQMSERRNIKKVPQRGGFSATALRFEIAVVTVMSEHQRK